MDRDSMQVESICLLPLGFSVVKCGFLAVSVLLEAGIPGLESSGTVLRMAPAGVAAGSSVCWGPGAGGALGISPAQVQDSKSISVVNVVLQERGCKPFCAALEHL